MAGNNIFIPSSYSKDFTLAKCIEYGLTVDYTFRNQLGFEQYKYSPNKATIKGEKAFNPAGKEYEILCE